MRHIPFGVLRRVRIVNRLLSDPPAYPGSCLNVVKNSAKKECFVPG